ncbi:hypothetical protein Q9L58_000557 [Maublancomyces gigas]|uniref:Uncharacterized protein n=1 Tax=Discina gigas TaxID=1032678 RepID=A0ABR3GWE8_9PEZI
MDTQHIAFSGFSSEYAVDSEKIPDAFVKVVGITHPSVVVETGWAEKMVDLKKDAKIWLCGTKGVTRVVIVVCFTEGKSPIAIPTEPDEESLDKDKHSATGTVNENTVGTATPHEPSQELTEEDANSRHDEKIPSSISSTNLPSVEEDSAESSLISSITKATIFADLVASLISLHSNNTLTKPLIGSVSGTRHLFRANSTFKSIIEFYTTSFLPPGDPSFRLSFADLLSPELASEHGLDPEDGLDFDMAELRNVVDAHMVDMCRKRAGRRAKTLMKEKGVWEKVMTFAESKRKRKRAGSGSGEDWNEKRKKQ